MRSAGHRDHQARRQRGPFREILATVVLLLAAAVAGQAQSGMSTAVVMTLSGRVSLERQGELWVLMAGQTVSAGQVIVTGPDGHVTLELPDQSTLEVFPDSRLTFRANRFNWSDLVDIFLGKIRLHIQSISPGEQPYRVTSPTAVISIRGTVLEVEVDSGEDTTVFVEAGVVGVRHRLFPGKEVLVESGQSLRVLQNVPLADAGKTPRIAIVGRVLRAAGEAVAQVSGGGRSGGGKPSSGGSAGGSTPGPADGDAGSNEPAPAPGEDDTSAPPGDAVP